MAFIFGAPVWFSIMNSLAKSPVWISCRISFISFLASAPMTLGPRVKSPYSAVLEME